MAGVSEPAWVGMPAPAASRRPRVIYLSVMRLTDRVARDWYVDHLAALGAGVQYWDVSDVLRDGGEEVGAVERPYHRRFTRMRDVDAALREPENAGAQCVMVISYTGNFTSIYRLVSRHGNPMLMINWGVLPTNPAPAWKKLLERWSSPRWLAMVAYYLVKTALFRKLGLVDPFAITFAAGRVARASAAASRRVVPINSVDYDHYVDVRDAQHRHVEGRYAVFLDINLPYQSDLGILGMPAVTPEAYFDAMNRFFRAVEDEHGLAVVIAAHPKTGYGSERFEGRTTLRGITAELVRDASLVLTHTSTAMSYAVLNGKPLVFVYTEEMRRIYKDNLMLEMRNYARYLAASMCSTDTPPGDPSLRFEPVAPERYEAYRYDFLTSPDSEHTTTRDIFTHEIFAAEHAGAGPRAAGAPT